MTNEINSKKDLQFKTIKFEFENKEYETDLSAYEKNRILLPDGRTLRCEIWLEVFPPYPIRLEVVAGVENPAIARYLGDVIIEEK